MSEINQKLVEKYKTEKLIVKTYYADQNGRLVDGIVNPLRIDNRQLMAPTDDQGTIPGCAGWSACTLAESIIWKKTGKLVQLDGAQVYAKAKELDGQMDVEGTYLETSLQAAIQLAAFGPDYKVYTAGNDGTDFTVELAKHLIHKHDFLQAGFMIDEGWYDCSAWDWTLHARGACLGGHAVNLCGYDAEGFYVLNQWGRSFGAKGYCVIPRELFLKQLIGLAWACPASEA